LVLANTGVFIKDFLLIIFIISFLYFYKTKVVPFGFDFSESGYPKDAAEFVINNKIPGKMFNHYNYGGYLIWKMPQYQVFIDGRLEMYQEQAGIDYQDVMGAAENYNQLLDKYGINFFLLYSTDPVIGPLLSNSDWRLVYRDSRFVVFVKNSDENAGIIEKYWSQASQDEVGQLYNNYLAEQFNSVGLDLIKKAKSMNDVIDAARYFENAVDLIPSNILFRLNLAKGLSDLGWWNESRVQYEEILTLDPENQQAKASIEWVNQMEKINAVPRAKRL
jgi:hypothetical protein